MTLCLVVLICVTQAKYHDGKKIVHEDIWEEMEDAVEKFIDGKGVHEADNTYNPALDTTLPEYGCDITVSNFPEGMGLNGKYKTQMRRGPKNWFMTLWQGRPGPKMYHGRQAFTCVDGTCAGKTLRFDGEGWTISKDAWEVYTVKRDALGRQITKDAWDPLVRCNSYATRPEEIGGCNWKHVGTNAVVGATTLGFTTCGKVPVPEVTETKVTIVDDSKIKA